MGGPFGFSVALVCHIRILPVIVVVVTTPNPPGRQPKKIFLFHPPSVAQFYPRNWSTATITIVASCVWDSLGPDLVSQWKRRARHLAPDLFEMVATRAPASIFLSRNMSSLRARTGKSTRVVSALSKPDHFGCEYDVGPCLCRT